MLNTQSNSKWEFTKIGLLLSFVSLDIFYISCEKPVFKNKTDVSVERDTQSVLLHNDWSKKRSEIQILSDYLKIGQNLDTIVKSYSELKYDSVLAINHLHGGMQAAGDTSKLDTIMKFHTLNVQQSENLIKTLESKETYFDPMSARCFVPHTTFVFYSKNEIVAYSSVCLRCGNISSTIKLVNGAKYSPLGKFGKKSFNSICKELNFSEFR